MEGPSVYPVISSVPVWQLNNIHFVKALTPGPGSAPSKRYVITT